MTNVSNLKISAYRTALTYPGQNWVKFPRIMSKNILMTKIWICPKIGTIHSIILQGHINSGYDPPHAWMHALQCWNMLLIILRIVPISISCQSSTRALVSSRNVLGCFGSHGMRWSMMSQRWSMGCRSGERAGQSIVSMPSSSSLAHSCQMGSGVVVY